MKARLKYPIFSFAPKGNMIYVFRKEELAEDPAYAFICYIDANYVADSGIQGISKDTVLGHHGVGIFWNIQDWTIEE